MLQNTMRIGFEDSRSRSTNCFKLNIVHFTYFTFHIWNQIQGDAIEIYANIYMYLEMKTDNFGWVG